MKTIYKAVLFILLGFVLPISAFAEDDDYAASGIFPPLQYPQSDASVTGLRMCWGWCRHKEMYGVDVGIIGNITDSKYVGMAFAGGFNRTSGDATIIFTQMALVNKGKNNIYGVQFGL